MTFDLRITPARPGLAAKHLEGKVTAARFVEGQEREVIDAQAPVREAPAPDAALVTEALMGERVTIYEFDDEGWAWGQLADDGYVGWLPANALMPPRDAPTHRVTALRTLAFPGPSIKLPPAAMPPLGSRVAVTREESRFAVSPARATATCRRRRWALRLTSSPCGVVIWCSGKDTSRSCATKPHLCTRTHFTWRSRSSRS